RGLQTNPTGIGLWEIKSKLAIFEKGDFSVAEKAFEAVKSMPMSNEEKLKIAGGRADVFLLQRKYKEGLREAESVSDDLLAPIPPALCAKYYLIGFARKALQDETGARAAFLKATDLLEAQLKQSPDVADMQIQLAKVLACATARGEWKSVSTELEPGSAKSLQHRYVVVEETTSGERASVEVALFSSKALRLRVIDQASEPRSDLAKVMQREKCLAGVN